MTTSSPPYYPWVSYQPLRALYTTYGWASILARLPLWALQASIPSLRPRRDWTFRQTLATRALYAVTDLNSTIGITEATTLDPQAEGDRFVVAQPAPAHVYTGPLAAAAAAAGRPDGVRPAPVGATWYPRAPAGPEGLETVVLWLHGGAFIMCNGRSADTGFAAEVLLGRAGFSAVLAPQYRLSSYCYYNKKDGRDAGGAADGNPFPAALQDALTAYLYLVRGVGVPASRIVVAGDSAGGNLAIALLRFLESDDGRAAGLAGEKPLCLALASPWVAPLDSLGASGVELGRSPNWKTDYVPLSFLQWGVKTYWPFEDAKGVLVRWFHPKGHAFQTSVPIYVSVTDAELLGPSVVEWFEEMRREPGNQLELGFERGATHDSIMIGHVLGWKESAEEVGRRIGEFVSKQRHRA